LQLEATGLNYRHLGGNFAPDALRRSSMRLRKTMTSSTQRWLAPLFIAGVTSVLLASCASPPSRGDNVAQINEAPLPNPDTSLLQGYVSQTRVSGTKCWIDRDADNILDFGETSTITSSNGLFSFTKSSLDDAQPYRIICTGGSARSVGTTAESVGVMLAPRGASNVTPLTTVVALNNELADKIGQTLLSSSSQNYSETYDVDIAKSAGTFGEHLKLAKGIETFMYVLGRSNPDLPIISSTQGHVDALKILADNLNELDSAGIFNSTSIASKIGEAATDTLNSTAVDSLISLSAADRSSIAADIQSSATAVMAAVSTGTGRKITESSVISACSNAFAASNLVANKTLSTKASSLPPYASSLTITDNLSSTLYSSSGGDFSVDNDSAVDNITVVFTESLVNGASLNIDNITFTIANSSGTTLEQYQVDNVTFAQSSTGVVSITINNAPSCDITTDKNSITLGYDNVTASCRTGTQNSLKGAAFSGGKFTVALIDNVSDNLSKPFEFNLTD
jgi:hypothetical protein